MGRKKSITPTKRARAWAFHQSGFSERSIAARLGISKNAVHNAVLLFTSTGSFKGRRIPGRPVMTTKADDRQIKRIIRSNPFASAEAVKNRMAVAGVNLSASTVRRRLFNSNLRSYSAALKPRLTNDMKAKRLAFAIKFRDWGVDEWKTVMWSDETMIEQFNQRRRKVRRPKGQRYNEKYTVQSVKHPETIMIWGCFSWQGRGGIEFIEKNQRMNSEKYIDILGRKLVLFLNIHGCTTFMQDKAPCHTSKATMAWMKQKKITVLDWPGNSPDLNPIEHLWNILKIKVHQKAPSSIPELKEAVKVVWAQEVTEDLCQRLVESMPRRLEAVIKSRGGIVKY